MRHFVKVLRQIQALKSCEDIDKLFKTFAKLKLRWRFGSWGI